MTSPSMDASELRTLGADLRAIPEQLNRHVVPVLKKGAQNIKEEMQAEMKASKTFAPLAGSITYDMKQNSFGGVGVYEVEIGPKKRSGGAGSQGLGFGANIAYFGSGHGQSRGSVKDPVEALNHETPKFEKAMGDLLKDLL